MELVGDTTERYRHAYGEDPTIVVSAPGRVNIIGEHTDYNQGFVLPVAIDRMITVAAGPRTDGMLHLHTVDLQGTTSGSLSNIVFDRNTRWSNYPKGVAHVYQGLGYRLSGANFCIRGNVPIGAGLSSSAALEVASAIAFKFLSNLSISLVDLIKVAHTAENEFVGVRCGIMDQFVSVMGKRDHALFLDCRSLEFSHVRWPDGVRLVICDTGAWRELARSAYNTRELECEETVRQIARVYPVITSLRDVSLEQLRAAEEQLSPTLRKRAHHVVTENDRVLRSVDAMRNGDLCLVGKLMTQSHASLRDDFEVSCKELNAFVDIATSTPGVYGARMTGAGFGGSAICLVAEEHVDDLVERLRTDYPKLAGRSITVYLAMPDDGAAVYFPRESLERISVTQLMS